MGEERFEGESRMWPRRLSSAMLAGVLAAGMVPAQSLAYASESHAQSQPADGEGGDSAPGSLVASAQSVSSAPSVSSGMPGSPQGAAAGDAASALKAKKESFGFPTDTVTVPYGVNIDAWLARDDVKLLIDKSGAPVAVNSLAGYFADGAKPLSFAGDRYPMPRSTFASELVWGALADGADEAVELPDLDDLQLAMAAIDADPDDHIESDALPLAPASVVSSLEGRTAKGEAFGIIAGSAEHGDLRFWIDAEDAAGTAKLKVGSNAPTLNLAFSPTADLKASGDFSSDKAGAETELAADSECVYIKLGQDTMTVDPVSKKEVKLLAGQIVRVPVCLDALAPSLSELTVANADGSPLNVQPAWVDNETLTVSSSGLRITCRIADPEPQPPAPAPQPGPQPQPAAEGALSPQEIADSVSGIDADSISLTVPMADGTVKSIPCDSYADGVATFAFNLKNLGAEGVYRLDDMKVNAADVAGNTSSTALSASPSFNGSGVTGIDLINEQSAENKPDAELIVSGTKPADDGVMYALPGESAKVEFRVTDRRFDELLQKQDWLAGNPISYVVDGGTVGGSAAGGNSTGGNRVSLDPRTFSKLSGSSMYQSAPSDALVLSDEGRYEVSMRYVGAKKYILGFIPNGSMEDADSETIVVDHTNPQVSGATMGGTVDPEKEIAKPAGSHEGAYTLIGGNRTISVDVADLPGAGAAEGTQTAGIASVRVSLVKRADLSGDAGTEVVRDYTAADAADGSIEVALDQDGAYRLGDIRIAVTDKAGNSTEKSLADVISSDPNAIADGWTYDTVVVDTASKPSSGMEVSEDTVVAQKDGSDIHTAAVAVTYWISDEPWAQLYLATDAMRNGIRTEHFPKVGGEAASMVDPARFEYSFERNRWEASVSFPTAALLGNAAKGALDGRYSLDFDYRDADVSDDADNHASFIVDTTAPVMTNAQVKGGFDSDRDVAVVGGEPVLVGGERTLRVRVQDLIPFSDATVENRDGEGISGVAGQPDGNGSFGKGAQVTVHRMCADSFADDAATEGLLDLVLDADSEGWVEIPLDHDGLYDLKDIVLDYRDAAGNEASGTLADCVASLPEAQKAQWPAQRILVDLPDEGADRRSVAIELIDAPGTPETEDPAGYFHRGALDAEVSVTDPWFEAYQSIASRQGGFFSATCKADDGSVLGADAMPKLPLSAFGYDEASGAWKARYALPADPAIGEAALPVQGDYELSVVYDGISGATDSTRASVSFGVDYTAPEFGRIELSKIDPRMWGWIFPLDSEEITADVDDNLSGVNVDTVSLDRSGVPTPADSLENGRLRIVLDEDAERLVFGDAKLRAKDIAGNERVIDPLSAHEDTNIPEDTVGVSVDAAAPTIGVSYDNNDVRNGRYFNAKRTATVTIEEANFDLIRENDPKRAIVTVRNGSAATEYSAEQFEPVHVAGKKDGTVWQLSIPFEEDGDWTLDAALTDPAGREAKPFHDEFTIDMTAPVLLVTFDNDSAANGMYFKAPRTATVEVHERNFDPALASVSPTSGTGNAPGVSGWTGDGRDGWTSTVHFGQEGRFALTASCTDFAGNAAEVIEVPEFVIDMTAPQVSIGGVEDRTAYAGQVAPNISYSDENFDPVFAMCELKGAKQGDVYMMGVGESEDVTSKHVSYPDFEHVLDRDDIYTLTATVSDLAGNEATDEVTFSVNRFGSNYLFEDATSQMAGRFLSKPQDVVVHEINVSGLDGDASHAEVIRDSRVQQLEAGADYTVAQNAEATGWSDTVYTFPASLFSEDGYYRVHLTSTDLAGNLSQNTMDAKNAARDASAEVAFAVDSTAPEAEIAGIESGGVYMDPHMKVGVDAHDNMELESAKLTVDGHEVGSWKGDDLADAYAESTLEADGVPHDITLTTVDRAGNKTERTYDDVVVAGNWLAYIRNTPSLLYGLIAGAIGALTAVGVAAGAIIHHRRKKAAERNPFER